MGRSRESEPGERPTPARRRVSALTIDVRSLAWTIVTVCMHCQAVVFVELPSGLRIWLPAGTEAADLLRAGAAGGPTPRTTHGVCQACVRAHYPDLLPSLRAQYPNAGY
jgi:hypothetical protein